MLKFMRKNLCFKLFIFLLFLAVPIINSKALTTKAFISNMPVTYKYNNYVNINYIDNYEMEEDNTVLEPISTFNYFKTILPIIFLAISIIFCHKKHVSKIDDFSFLTKLNSLEVAFLNSGRVNKKDIGSLLIYLANKGYIKIIEGGVNSDFKDFKIIKVKEYDGDNSYEAKFLKNIFKSNHVLSNKSIKMSEVNDSFPAFLKSILDDINKNKNMNKSEIFKRSILKSLLMIVMIVISSFIVIETPTLIEDNILMYLSVILLFYGFGHFLFSDMRYYLNTTQNGVMFTILIMFITTPMLSYLIPGKVASNDFYGFGFVSGLLAILGMIICLIYEPKRTEYGNQLYGELKGLKHFFNNVSKDELEALVLKNPNYYSDMLPYAYVLGLSDKWALKFENIKISAPTWYVGSKDLNARSFEKVTDNIIFSVTNLNMLKMYKENPNQSNHRGLY